MEHQLAMDRLGEIVARHEEGHEPLTETEVAAAADELFGDSAAQPSA